MEEIGILEDIRVFGLLVDFDNVVEKTISNWQIESVTLLTRIGGIIGVGKELLWILITLITYLIVFYTNISRY